ncbi:hypothetical protein Micbo1qcDRAFT_165742, partial [Microdochium bolleyi]
MYQYTRAWHWFRRTTTGFGVLSFFITSCKAPRRSKHSTCLASDWLATSENHRDTHWEDNIWIFIIRIRGAGISAIALPILDNNELLWLSIRTCLHYLITYTHHLL